MLTINFNHAIKHIYERNIKHFLVLIVQLSTQRNINYNKL